MAKHKSSIRKKTTKRKRPVSRRRSKKTALKRRRQVVIFVILAILIILGVRYPQFYRNTYFTLTGGLKAPTGSSISNAIDRTNLHYGGEVEKNAAQFGFSVKYLKSLIILESSGRKNVPPRFEKHVYRRLKQLKYGEISQFENLRPHHLKDATDAALKNLARSWGPFQIMGYKCILLGINIKDLRGDKAIFWGVKWIDLTYGDYLRKGKYMDCFHIHNTGKPYPKVGSPRTYDPNYVKNGMKYMSYF